MFSVKGCFAANVCANEYCWRAFAEVESAHPSCTVGMPRVFCVNCIAYPTGTNGKKQFRRSPHIAHFQEVETISKRRGNSSRIFKQSHCARRNVFARSGGERSRKKERKRKEARAARSYGRTVNKLFASRVLRRMSMSVVNKGVGTDAINGCERR